MARLIWGDPADRTYEAGVDRGVLYPHNGVGVVWNGLVSMLEAPSEFIENAFYVDGTKYLNESRGGSFAATLGAFTYPSEFLPYDGVDVYATNQMRKTFGLSYRTKNKIHLVYNALATPTDKSYATEDSSAEPTIFSWALTTAPILIWGARPTAHLVIDIAKANEASLADIEAVLYGTDTVVASLPSPEDVLEIFESNAVLRVIDHRDGTYTVTGPDEAIQMIDPTIFQISWDSAVFVDEDTYTISSL